ncbi:MAG: hypothetical protein QXL78_00345 [Methanocellales archaeon]
MNLDEAFKLLEEELLKIKEIAARLSLEEDWNDAYKKLKELKEFYVETGLLQR